VKGDSWSRQGGGFDTMALMRRRRRREQAVQTAYAHGDGTQSRDFTLVDDIVRGTVAALRPLGFQIVNLGNQRPVPLLQLIALIERATGAASRIEFRASNQADVAMTCASVSKAKALLGWSPDVPLEDGVRRLVRWYDDNRAWAREIAL
jgi:UDP-glucuronate 4-epimerase